MSTLDTRPALPTVVDRETWQRERDSLLAREKAHTREGDAIAAARRRLPITEIAPLILNGEHGPVSLLDVFAGRNQLVVYRHMWHLGRPIEGQCEGCTLSIWHMHNPAYLEVRGVSFAVLCGGPWEDVAPFRDFMGYSVPWYSTYGLDEPAVVGDGTIACFLREGERVFLTYESTGRGVEAIIASLKLLDMTVYGRQEPWEDSPEGWPQNAAYSWWLKDGRPVAQWTRPGVTAVGASPECDGGCGAP